MEYPWVIHSLQGHYNMASMIKSIFGLTTEDVREEQLKQQRALADQLQKQGTSAPAAQFGVSFGSALGRGLMERFGFQSPEMEKAQQVEAMQSELDAELAKFDPSDPARNYIIGQALIRAGQPEEAARYFALGRQADALASQQLTSKQELELRERQLKVAENAEARKQGEFEFYSSTGAFGDSPTTDPTQAQQVTDPAVTKTTPADTTPPPLTAEQFREQARSLEVGEMMGTGGSRVIMTESGLRPVTDFTTEQLLKLRSDQPLFRSIEEFNKLSNEQKHQRYLKASGQL